MHSSDALRRRAAEKAAEHAPNGTTRSASRIITAERLAGYAPFAMHPLLRDDPMGTPGLQQARGSAGGKDAQSLFARFAVQSGVGAEPDEPETSASAYDTGRKAGLVDGFKRGFDAGVAHAGAEQRKADEQAGATLSGRLEALCGELQQRFEQIERSAADQVVALALEVARQALRATLAVRPETIVPVVQEALAHLFDEQLRVHLHMNPGDVALVRDELGERLASTGCEIVGDASIAAGGCRIETPRAAVDATVETRWRRTLAAIGRNEDGSLAQTAEPHR